jgi:hypothetical protein
MRRWSSVAIALAMTCASLVYGGGCGKKKTAAKTAGDAGAASAVGGPAAPAPHPDVSSALWAFAPADAKFGFVVGDGVGEKARLTVKAIVDDIGTRSFAAPVQAALAQARKELEFDPLDPAGWKSIGIDINKGFATFMAPPNPKSKEPEHPIMVLPVVDREAFRKKTKGKTETIDGKEVDRIEDDLVCMPVADRYVCAKNVADIATASGKHDSPIASAALAVPAEARGDLELYADLAGIPEAQDELAQLAPFGKLDAVGFGARLEPDGFSMRGWSKGAVDGPIGKGLIAATPRADFTGKTGNAASVMRMRIDPKLFLEQAPKSIPLGGVDLRTDLVDQLTGDLQVVTAGKGLIAGTIVLGIEDAAKVTGALKSVCAVAKAAIGQKDNPVTKLDIGDAGCKGELDFARLEKNLKLVLPMDLKVEGKLLVITVGDVDPARLAGNAADDAVTAETRAMLAAPATFVAWSRAFDTDYDALPSMFTAEMKKDPNAGVMMDVGNWMASSVYELGLATVVQADGSSIVLRLTTFAGDPPEARTAYQAALSKRTGGDRAGYQAALADIAKKWPTSRIGKRARLEAEGTPVLGPASALAGAGMAAYLAKARMLSEPAPPAAPAKGKPGFGKKPKPANEP